MSEDPFDLIIDNKAQILSEDKEGSVRTVFEYYINQAMGPDMTGDFSIRMDIGSGYLFFSGFKSTADLFRKLLENDVLQVVDDKDWGTTAPIRVVMGPETTRLTKEILTSMTVDSISRYDDQDIQLLRTLLDRDLIDFRVYVSRRFHAKVYSFYLTSSIPDDIWAGSANFTRGGLTDNIELCIPMRTTSKSRKLFRDWFDNLWDQASSDLDVLEIINMIRKSDYIYYDPGIFFAKVLKIMDKEYLLEDEQKWANNILLEFQNLSYYIVMERLRKYGGYILANSVGLGKSYVACQTMKTYLRQAKCLLIIPPRLRREWKSYLEEFDLEDQVDVISMGVLQKTPYTQRENSDEVYFDHREYSDRYPLIVVDEVHHYRNNSNRRTNLHNIIGANPKSHCLFLSATPVNLGSEDLFNLIDLFYRGANVYKFENEGLRELYDKTRREVKKIGREGKEKLDSNLINRIKEIEGKLSLKISWRIVQEHFEADLRELSGKKVQYEEPETNEVQFTYPSSYKTKIFDEIAPFLERLNYEPAKLWDGQGYKDDKNLTFWYKWQLYKRLESSLFAFHKSIENLRDRFRIYLTTLERGQVQETANNLAGMDDRRYGEMADMDRLRVVLSTFREQNEDKRAMIISRLKEDLKETDEMMKTLDTVLGSKTDIPYPNDKKLQKLTNLLKENQEEGKPTIVFSEWKDTVYYLFESLKAEFGPKIDFIHGMTKKSKDALIEAFQDGRIDIILTTDVLSEGVNIPRADCIVNYDLPYNPVLLVQRAGRALRITNPKKIFIYNFKPEKDIDKELDLYERLDVRLQTILNIVGLDFIVWLIDEKRVKELHEEEMKDYLENYSEFKEKIATTNPDDLLSVELPEESKLDRILRRAIIKFKIDSDLLGGISKRVRKPIYTVLHGDMDFYLITRLGEKIKLINEIGESLDPVRGRTKIGSSDRDVIKKEMKLAAEGVLKEKTSKRDLSRKIVQLINSLKKQKSRFQGDDMKDTVDRIIEGLSRGSYQPEEILAIETALLKIAEYPSFIKISDGKIKEMNEWGELKTMAERAGLKRDMHLLALIKYVGAE